MDSRAYLRTIRISLWRIMQVTVIFPSAMVGIFIAMMVLTGERPVEKTLENIYSFAETNVRPATQGHVLVSSCNPQTDASGLTKSSTTCDTSAPREVSISEATASAAGRIQYMYWVLVAVSSIALLMDLLGRRKTTPNTATV